MNLLPIVLPKIRVPLTRGQFAVINECDAPKVLPFRWYALKDHCGYYARATTQSKGKITKMFMHRLIMGFPAAIVDHKDRNTLNNIRSNLRLATAAQSGANRRWRKRKEPSVHRTPYKGVAKFAEGNYKAYLSVKSRKLYLGTFATAEEAARAYNLAAIRQWGEFATLNTLTT